MASEDWIEECARKRQNVPIQRPMITRYISDMCGRHIFADVFCVVEEGRQKNPLPIAPCALSRCVMARPSARASPAVVSGALVLFWKMRYGRCRMLLSDRGPGPLALCLEKSARPGRVYTVPAPRKPRFQMDSLKDKWRWPSMNISAEVRKNPTLVPNRWSKGWRSLGISFRHSEQVPLPL